TDRRRGRTAGRWRRGVPGGDRRRRRPPERRREWSVLAGEQARRSSRARPWSRASVWAGEQGWAGVPVAEVLPGGVLRGLLGGELRPVLGHGDRSARSLVVELAEPCVPPVIPRAHVHVRRGGVDRRAHPGFAYD